MLYFGCLSTYYHVALSYTALAVPQPLRTIPHGSDHAVLEKHDVGATLSPHHGWIIRLEVAPCARRLQALSRLNAVPGPVWEVGGYALAVGLGGSGYMELGYAMRKSGHIWCARCSR